MRALGRVIPKRKRIFIGTEGESKGSEGGSGRTPSAARDEIAFQAACNLN